jgi:hypothetical protein
VTLALNREPVEEQHNLVVPYQKYISFTISMHSKDCPQLVATVHAKTQFRILSWQLLPMLSIHHAYLGTTVFHAFLPNKGALRCGNIASHNYRRWRIGIGLDRINHACLTSV